jgi:hypothetical protein
MLLTVRALFLTIHAFDRACISVVFQRPLMSSWQDQHFYVQINRHNVLVYTVLSRNPLILYIQISLYTFLDTQGYLETL